MIAAAFLLFFHLFVIGAQQYAEWPFYKKNVSPKSDASTPYYNPSDQAATVYDIYGNQIIEPERQVIFEPTRSGDGGNGSDNNNPYFTRRPHQRFQKYPVIIAQIQLFEPDEFYKGSLELENQFPSFTYNSTYKTMFWQRNNKDTLTKVFQTLEDAIIDVQENGFNAGSFEIWGQNMNILKDHKLYTSTKPNREIHDLKATPFTLFITTLGSPTHIKIALEIALANSRLRDLHEGCYAIIGHFDKSKAIALSKEDQNGKGFNKTLFEAALSHCTIKKIPEINAILREPGDEQYLATLQSYAQEIADHDQKKEPSWLPPTTMIQISLQLYSAAKLAMLVKKIWTTKQIPKLPQSLLQKAYLFTLLLGTGLLIKNLAYKAYPFILQSLNKKEENKENK